MAVFGAILILGLLAGCLSGIVGTGASIVLLPILVFAFGPQQAIPIMAVAAVMGNIAKVLSWWRIVNWRAFAAYSLPGAVGAALGARTLLELPPHLAETVLGVFFLALIPGRRLLQSHHLGLGLAGLAVAGGVIGFLSGIVLSTGPISIPVFAAFGLTQGGLISTEAASSLVVSIGKVGAFYAAGALPPAAMIKGLLIGATVMAVAFMGRQVLMRMSARMFELVLDAMLATAGISMLVAALA